MATPEHQRDQEGEFLGHLSPGIAHDIKSLLTPVSTYLQISQENPSSSENLRELLPIAIRNLETVQAYIDQGLYFAKNKTPNFRAALLDQLVLRAVQLAEPDLKRKQQRVELRVPDSVTAEMDEILILRLLNNLIANAVDAARAEAVVRLEVDDSASQSVFVSVSNSSPESESPALREVPARQRHGLGLQICREIVQWHRGEMTIEDSPDAGRTVRVKLPRHVTQHQEG